MTADKRGGVGAGLYLTAQLYLAESIASAMPLVDETEGGLALLVRTPISVRVCDL